MGSQGGPSCNETLWQPHKGSTHIANGQSHLGLRCPVARAGRHKAPILQGGSSPPLAPLLLIPVCGMQPSSGPSRDPRKGSPSSCHCTGLVAITHQASQHPKGACLRSPSRADRLPCLCQARLEGACRHSPHHAPSAHGLQKTCPDQGNTSPPQARGKKTQENKGEHFAKAMFAQVT